jgi:pyruvate/2-oxoglutarate dehydrogenase complex dihydrolipoamide dehydrogenase (E3) component
MAVRNAYLPLNEKGVLDRVPWSTFTDPEVAHAGLTEAQARSKFGEGVMVCNWPLEKVDRALTDGDATGFVKLIHKANGTILGVTVAAPRAGEMIQ